MRVLIKAKFLSKVRFNLRNQWSSDFFERKHYCGFRLIQLLIAVFLIKKKMLKGECFFDLGNESKASISTELDELQK